MSTFKYSKGKLVEHPEPCPVNCSPSDMVKGGKCDINGCYSWEPREYIAEGFAEDELVEEKDLVLVYQGYNIGYKNKKWMDCPENIYNSIDSEYRRIIARKVTKEEGEKPEAMNQLDLQTFKDAYIERNDAYNKAIQEIERLKGLIKEGFVLLQKQWRKEPEQIEIDWKIFKSENDLT